MIDHMTSAITNRVACKALHPMIRRSIAANQPHLGRYNSYNGMAYDAQPRQRWIARDFGPVLGKGGTGWLVPCGDSDHVSTNYDATRMMTWFGCHVRDALAFNY